MFKETYLGDGVYASFDGYNIILDLRAQDNSYIVLEPQVIDALHRFEESIKEEMKRNGYL